MLPAPTPTPSSEPPPFWFVAPDGFYALPLADTAEERAAAAERFVRGLYVEGTRVSGGRRRRTTRA